ncbi:MAG: hypothetical protein K6G62_03265 [Eubacterium sp.]|nr:hypothetical protein [Eubacterium sp.]
MNKRRDMARRSALVRELIDDNQYIEALQVIDGMDLESVESTSDLNLFADLYEKAERFDKKKEIYYILYKRNHSRYVLNRLLRLVLRMGDMEEARELFLAYEMAGDVTLDTFELRYLLAKAEGASRTVLIDILEELKQEEFTEEWGYQLARLYEQEGRRQDCIRVCDDIVLWFGSGKIVEKAKILKEEVESDDWEPSSEEDIPEVEEVDPEEIIPYAAAPIKVSDFEDEEEEEEEDQPAVIEDEGVAGLMEEIPVRKRPQPVQVDIPQTVIDPAVTNLEVDQETLDQEEEVPEVKKATLKDEIKTLDRSQQEEAPASEGLIVDEEVAEPVEEAPAQKGFFSKLVDFLRGDLDQDVGPEDEDELTEASDEEYIDEDEDYDEEEYEDEEYEDEEDSDEDSSEVLEEGLEEAVEEEAVEEAQEDSQEDPMDELKAELSQSMAVEMDVEEMPVVHKKPADSSKKEDLASSVQEIMEAQPVEPIPMEVPSKKKITDTLDLNDTLDMPEVRRALEGAPLQMEVEEDTKPLQMEVQVEKEAPRMEVRPNIEPEDISENGISYQTLKATMSHLAKHETPLHFAFAGGEDRINLAVAKRLTKELNKIGYFSAGSINRISAEKLNEIELIDQEEKMLGGCTLITQAPELNQKSVYDLIHCMKKYQGQAVVMLSGPFDEMDCFLANYPELAELFDYKVRM